MSNLTSVVEAFCRTHNLIKAHDTIVIGVSGGPDSVCLLSILMMLAPEYKLQLHVAHFNHALRGQESDEDAAYVADLAVSLEVPSHIAQQDVAEYAGRNKLNLEDAARRLRYRFLAEVAEKVGARKIAVAHHANDQAETVLMNLLRGAGVSGLRGMQPRVSLAEVIADAPDRLLIRPLLNTNRADIEQFCQEHQLSTRFDSSNQDSAYTRNRIRHDLLPLLETYNPNIYQALTRTAILLAGDDDALTHILDQTWQTMVISQTDSEILLDLKQWPTLPPALQRRFLRRAVIELGQSLQDIDFAHIEQAMALLKQGKTNTRFELPDRLSLRIDYQTARLSIGPQEAVALDWPQIVSPQIVMPVQLPGITSLPDSPWSLHLEIVSRSEVPESALAQSHRWQAYLNADNLEPPLMLRSRKPGDRFAPFGMAGQAQKLKDFFINQKIPLANREKIPLMVSEAGHIYWVCGWRTDHHSQVTAESKRVVRATFSR